MRQRRITQKDILIISISIFFVVVLWIGFNIYNSWTTSTISPDLKLQITPIDPNFDKQTLSKLKKRQKIEPISALNSQTIASPAAKQPTPTPSLQISGAPAAREATPTEEVAIPTDTPTTTPTP